MQEIPGKKKGQAIHLETRQKKSQENNTNSLRINTE